MVASESCCPFSQVGVFLGADQGHYNSVTPLICVISFRGAAGLRRKVSAVNVEKFAYLVTAPASRI